MLKVKTQVDRPIKNVCKMNQSDKSDFDPQVKIDIEGVLMPQVVIDFGSQDNILPRTTWIKLGQLELEKLDFYIKLID